MLALFNYRLLDLIFLLAVLAQAEPRCRRRRRRCCRQKRFRRHSMEVRSVDCCEGPSQLKPGKNRSGAVTEFSY